MLAMPGNPLITIDDDGTYELEAAVEESRSQGITIGQIVRIEIDALDRSARVGKVREMVPSSDPSTRTCTVKITINAVPNNSRLRSGLFGRAIFTAGERGVLVVPESALIRRGQLEGVYIVQKDIALFRLIKTGKRFEQQIEVLSGLTPGTRIVVEPTNELSDGMKIIEAAGSRP
jgi:RND family efflux transporter MFP subunit